MSSGLFILQCIINSKFFNPSFGIKLFYHATRIGKSVTIKMSLIWRHNFLRCCITDIMSKMTWNKNNILYFNLYIANTYIGHDNYILTKKYLYRHVYLNGIIDVMHVKWCEILYLYVWNSILLGKIVWKLELHNSYLVKNLNKAGKLRQCK